MSWVKFASREEHRFTTGDDVPLLPSVRNPDARPFLPRTVTVTYHDGRMDVYVWGPFLGRSGKPLTRYDGSTSYDADDILATRNGTANDGDAMPEWLIDLVATVDNGRTPGVVVQP